MRPSKNLTIISLAVLANFSCLFAQDPFVIHFHSSPSAFNPSLVGYAGALSLMAKYKTQWNADGIEAFQTSYISMEESLICSIFDYGLFFQYDQEGPGIFRTYDVGFRLAGTIPLPMWGVESNIRLGTSFQWSQKTIDYSQLIFSDQLDPKYGTNDVNGNPLLTSFVFPEHNRSLPFFAPAVGISHKLLFNHNSNSKKPHSVSYGASLQNSYPIGSERIGNVESILQLSARIPRRTTFFLQGQFVPYNSNNNFFTFHPMILFQRQSELEYWEIGSKFSFNRFISAGMFYHFNETAAEGNNTNWISFLIEFGDVIFNGGNGPRSKSKKSRYDLSFSFSNKFSGLKNHVGPIMEFSLAYHFDSGIFCRSHRRGPDNCNHFITKEKRKIYENIWHKTIHANYRN